jgi:hypothetical protein
MSKSQVLDALAAVLSPYLGETMARASAQTQCQKLAIEGDDISTGQIEALVGKLGNGLNVFVGRERAAAVVAEMKRAVAGQGEAP